MQIAIFENEYDSVKGAFATANLLNFNNELEFTVYPSSQNANLSQLNDFSLLFIDIDLSSKSDLDGFSLIQKIQTVNPNLSKRIIILTGNNKIGEVLKQRNINPSSVKIIVKPTNYEEITENIKQVLKSIS